MRYATEYGLVDEVLARVRTPVQHVQVLGCCNECAEKLRSDLFRQLGWSTVEHASKHWIDLRNDSRILIDSVTAFLGQSRGRYMHETFVCEMTRFGRSDQYLLRLEREIHRLEAKLRS